MRIFNFGCIQPELNDAFPLSIPCSWESIHCANNGPAQRNRHTVCLHQGFLYLYGGRSINGTENDFWRCDVATNTWSEIRASGEKPPPLEGHTILEFNEKLYVFGGEMSFSRADETPLWIFHPKSNTWSKKAMPSSDHYSPCGRREHVAVLYRKQMYIYGGYIDLKGPSLEMWSYNFKADSWVLKKSAMEGNTVPSARYKHSAVVYGDTMWVTGGLMGVSDKNHIEAWNWNFTNEAWTALRTRNAPQQIFGHAMCLINNHIFIYGGNKEDGQIDSKLWRIKVSWKTTQAWHACHFVNGIHPSLSSSHCLVSLPSYAYNHIGIEHSKSTISVAPFHKKLNRKLDNLNDNSFKQIPVKKFSSCENIIQVAEKQPEDFVNREIIQNNLYPENVISNIQMPDFTKPRSISAGNGSLNKTFELNNDKILLLGKTRSSSSTKSSLYSYSNPLCNINSSQNSLHNFETVNHFSYNLNSTEKLWRPNEEKHEVKYETTSFIETPTKDNPADFVWETYNEKPDKNSSFYENSKILQNLENIENDVANLTASAGSPVDNYLLLVGGKLGETSQHVAHPITMWKCKFVSRD